MSKAAVALIVSALLLASCGDDEEPVAPTTTTEAAEPVLSPEGLGDLRIGMTSEEASATGAIGDIGPGCELAGPGEEGAELADADGVVTFEEGVLTNIDVRGGVATAEGVAPGESLDDVRSTYGEVEVDMETEEVFGIWVARARVGYEFVVDPTTEEIQSIATPRVLFCE